MFKVIKKKCEKDTPLTVLILLIKSLFDPDKDFCFCMNIIAFKCFCGFYGFVPNLLKFSSNSIKLISPYNWYQYS